MAHDCIPNLILVYRECIESSAKVKAECPLCKEPFFRRSIKKDVKLQNILDCYFGLKEALKDLPSSGNKAIQKPDVKMKENIVPNNETKKVKSPAKRKRGWFSIIQIRSITKILIIYWK